MECQVGIHFYKHKWWRHRLVSLLTLSSIVHVDISIETPNGISYYVCSWPFRSGWKSGPTTFLPFDSLYETADIPLKILDLALPKGEKYSLWKVLCYMITGYPKYPSSCVSSVHRLRFLYNKQTKGRTPSGLYKALRKELRHTA